jgi:two-component system response regulator GlrR
MIADDDPVVGGSLAAVLECEGYIVEQALNDGQLVRLAIKNTPDLVLLDIDVSHWDGWAAFSQLERATPLVPIIIITARPAQYEKAARLGVDGFMEKPLDIPLLVDAIKRLVVEDSHTRVERITRKEFVTEFIGGADKARPPGIRITARSKWPGFFEVPR